ncbi:MAG: outer membrane lipoprotein LolB, partial [Methylococcaceae bacterium]|nr:outer membrane lipoprotein LolB [Methylococcaceae bacterium]
FYQLKKWSFDGRLALFDGKESWSASIEWTHSDGKDELKLSGPLGQGAVAISLTENSVTIDRGDEQIQQSTDVDAFIEQQLGIFIPVRALRYWVLGLTAPEKEFVELTGGFEQEKWIIQYLQMQQTDKEKWMPRKLKAHQNKTRLKLIIDNWML